MMRVLSKEETEFEQKLKQTLLHEITRHIILSGDFSESATVILFVNDSRLIDESVRNITDKAYDLLQTFKFNKHGEVSEHERKNPDCEECKIEGQEKTAKVEKRGEE